MSRNAVLALIAVTLALHDAEEYFTFPAFIAKASARQISGWLPAPAMQHSMTNLHIALILATVLPAAVIVWAIFSRSRKLLVAALFVEAILLVNAFAHSLTAIALASYVPGLVSAVLINLPFGIYVLRRAAREGWISGRAAWQMIAIAAFLHVVWLSSGMLTAARTTPR